MLTADDVSFRHTRRSPWVVRGVSLQVGDGELVGLRGDSGAGKTTLGRLLAGYLTPGRGHVAVDGDPVRAGRGRACPVQLVLQHPELAVDPRWRLQEILAEAGPPDPDLLDALSIATSWERRYPSELSGGELQRVAVARALTARPRYLVADELSAMLDPLTQAQLWQVILRRVRQQRLGVLVVSHDRPLLDMVADRVLTIEEGVVGEHPDPPDVRGGDGGTARVVTRPSARR